MGEEAKPHCHALLFNDYIGQFFRHSIKPNDRSIILFRHIISLNSHGLTEKQFTYSEHLHYPHLILAILSCI